MNQQAFEAGKAAFDRGDVLEAVKQLGVAKDPGEVSGTVDHLLGNCFMRMGRYEDAARCYADALQDGSYGHTGALSCNRGRALLAANHPQEAVASLTMAVQDGDYPTPYKAYTAMGRAYKRLGNPREAGVAFRNAAIDESNPDPTSALSELGVCFMQMGRAVDAVEAFRTALDFAGPLENQSSIYGDLGLAYVAANRMSEAVDAFNHATESGYQLRPEAQAAFDAARKAVSAIQGGGPSETDAFLAAAGYGAAIDPLDPTGATGEVMPSPDDTGFFSVSEEELVAQDRSQRKARKKSKKAKKGHGGRVFAVILVILLILAAGAGYAYYRGYGWPTQDKVVQDLLQGGSEGDVDGLFADSVGQDQRTQLKDLLPSASSSVNIDSEERSMASTTVVATVTLPAGGTQQYRISLSRDGIGWKVSGLEAVYASQDSASTTTTPTATGTISTTSN